MMKTFLEIYKSLDQAAAETVIEAKGDYDSTVSRKTSIQSKNDAFPWDDDDDDDDLPSNVGTAGGDSHVLGKGYGDPRTHVLGQDYPDQDDPFSVLADRGPSKGEMDTYWAKQKGEDDPGKTGIHQEPAIQPNEFRDFVSQFGQISKRVNDRLGGIEQRLQKLEH